MSNRLIEERGSDGQLFTEEKIYYLGTYHKYWLDKARGIKNPSFDRFSSKILDLKRGKKAAIEYFYSILENKIPDDENLMICVVPSSNPGAGEIGMIKLGRMLAERKGLIDGLYVLERTTKIPKLAYGGNRSRQVHYASVSTDWRHIFQGKDVFFRKTHEAKFKIRSLKYLSIIRTCLEHRVMPIPSVKIKVRVLLMDDVTTSGNSLRACRDILKRYDVEKVYMLALGKTAKE